MLWRRRRNLQFNLGSHAQTRDTSKRRPRAAGWWWNTRQPKHITNQLIAGSTQSDTNLGRRGARGACVGLGLTRSQRRALRWFDLVRDGGKTLAEAPIAGRGFDKPRRSAVLLLGVCVCNGPRMYLFHSSEIRGIRIGNMDRRWRCRALAVKEFGVWNPLDTNRKVVANRFSLEMIYRGLVLASIETREWPISHIVILLRIWPNLQTSFVYFDYLFYL